MPRNDISAVDLDIKVSVRTVDVSRVLHYALNSPSGAAPLTHRETQTAPFTSSFDTYRDRVIQRLEKLQEHRDPYGSYLKKKEVELEIRKLGHELYRQLFPIEMKWMYRQWRETVRTIQISSAEWWIPWELIRPFDYEIQPMVDDDFLGARYQITRWLIGGSAPAPAIRVLRMACVEAGQSGRPRLPHAAQERELLADLARRRNVEDVSPAQPTFPKVMSLLERGGLDLLHFVGHGEFSRDNPEDSRIRLADARFLVAREIDGPLLRNIAKTRPLIYFNACSTAQQGAALTSLSGWPDAWVGRGGAGAFVAPQWQVRDSLAFEFARIFYQALDRGWTLGRAARLARWWVRRKDRRDATWLAFAVYGHPHARVSFGTVAEQLRSPVQDEVEGSSHIKPPKISKEPREMAKLRDFIKIIKSEPEVQVVQELKGRIGASLEYGSGWIDLSPPIDFKKGDRLRLTLEGSARKILIRFLPQGGKPDLPVGIASGGPFEVPESKIVVLSLEEDHKQTSQVSVHGGPNPWRISLGEGNGPVALVGIERLKNEKQGETETAAR